MAKKFRVFPELRAIISGFAGNCDDLCICLTHRPPDCNGGVVLKKDRFTRQTLKVWPNGWGPFAPSVTGMFPG